MITLPQLVRGAVGVTKVALKVGLADEAEEKDRRSVCDWCREARPCSKSKPFEACKCAKCGCRIRLKVKVKSEKCPLNFW